MTDIVLSIVMLAALALLGGAYALWRRTGQVKQPALLVLLAVIVGALAVLYRYGPDRPGPPWRVVAIGAVAAALLWLIASLAFSVYVRNFGSYNETYGALGGVVVLLLWLWISALVTLLGAEMNAVLDPRRRERR